MTCRRTWKALARAAGDRKNALQLFFVFAAFGVMVLTGYLFVQNIVWNRLLESSNRSLAAAEAYIRAAFAEAEISLLNTYHAIQDRIGAGASQRELLEYLADTTAWMRKREGVLELYGVYGYIRGEFIDGISLNPEEPYIFQRRPWYQAGIRSGGSTAYTAPYTDLRTGNLIVSAARYIDNAEGKIEGVLAVDMNIARLNEYVQDLSLSEGGYGMIVSQNMTVVAHPQEAFRGRQLDTLGEYYHELSRMLRTGEAVLEKQIQDSGGGKALAFFSPLSNGWYVGLVTPYRTFYRDLFYAAAVLAVLGGALALALGLALLRLNAARMRSDEESKAKSSFLARMSHEIRTPMNAIIGMGELALQAESPAKMAEYVGGIKQAGLNLLSLVNDILDFSKIEAGNLQITPAPYELSALLNGVINVARVRIAEKPVLFMVTVDPAIPLRLYGDEARIRQILLNLLSNAAKYTQRGFIALTVNADYQDIRAGEEYSLVLYIEVADSGIGIKPEDLSRLFGNFVRMDLEKNRNIEGSGLGLAITRSLCRAMDGDVMAQSEYGKGSVFTAVIPQGYFRGEAVALVENPQEKGVLLYDRRRRYAESIGGALQKMGVPVSAAVSPEDFFAQLESGRFPYAFADPAACEEAAARIAAKGLNTRPVMFSGLGDALAAGNLASIPMPAYAVPLANILNGRDCGSRREKAQVRFTAPRARLLIVDDIATNLKVAEGLLAPYQAQVDTCLSGAEAVRLIQRHGYDMVFMDHMMPGMDGIEAAAAIRSWEADSPGQRPPARIIALTANAIAGMKELFLEKGFNDYLSKPIELAKLHGIMEKWIPPEKREAAGKAARPVRPLPHGRPGEAALPQRGGPDTAGPVAAPTAAGGPDAPLNIPGLDTRRGLIMTGGTETGYRQVLALFSKDAEERLPLLRAPPGAEGLPGFITQVHALKSAAASIGAAAVSSEAALLEEAGKRADLWTVGEKLPAFAQCLAELARNIRAALGEAPSGGQRAAAPSPGVAALLGELILALESQKADAIDRLLRELSQQTLDGEYKKTLESISDDVLMTEFDRAAGSVKRILGAEHYHQ
ncbi:MAG: response regulator [Treponema sp.]|jgi:signal transduction histidine kinase/CheY-like chemotaxis protein|nr:response regulator [Treponema sp.]